MKYICKHCPKPCEIIVEDGSDTPMCCPYRLQWYAVNWHEVDETLQPTCNQLATDLQDKQLPDWCKRNGYVYDSRNGYGKIKSVRDDRSACYIEFDGGAGDFVPEAFAELKQARCRPYNADEMKLLVGKVLTYIKNDNLNMVTDYINEVDEDDPSYHYCTVYVNGDHYVASELLDEFTINGSPCGVLEHLENGAWVK